MNDYAANPHQHKFYMFQIKTAFEIIPGVTIQTGQPVLYHMVDYGYLFCNCGATVKSLIKPELKEVEDD